MTVSGIPAAAQPAAALTDAARAAQDGARQDPQQIRQFDGLMQAGRTQPGAQDSPAPVATNAAAAVQPAPLSAPPTAQAMALQPPGALDMQMTPSAPSSSLMEQLRSYTNNLDKRYSQLQSKQVQMLSSMTQNRGDPVMAMAQAMDFQWNATTTISEYQLSLAVAQATNGLTHSILKNQE